MNSNSALTAFVQRVKKASGIVVSSPVYAGGYPGTLKNALDWLVGTDAFVNKPFMMLSASNRVPMVEETLVTVLETMSGRHVRNASTTIALIGKNLDVTQIVDDADMRSAISSALAEFAGAVPS
jgi:NAD(P)H-dependent FMN reductase